MLNYTSDIKKSTTWQSLIEKLDQHFESFKNLDYVGFLSKPAASSSYSLHLSEACIPQARSVQFSLDDLSRGALGNHTYFFCCATCTGNVYEANHFTGMVYTTLDRVYYLFKATETATPEQVLQALSLLDAFTNTTFALAEFVPDVVEEVKRTVKSIFDELFTLFVSANQEMQQKQVISDKKPKLIQALVYMPLVWTDDEDADDEDYYERMDAYKHFERLMQYTTQNCLSFWEVRAPKEIITAFPSEEVVLVKGTWSLSTLEATTTFIKDGLSVKEAFATAQSL